MRNHSAQTNKKRVIGAEILKKMENYGGWVQEGVSFVVIVQAVERNIVQNQDVLIVINNLISPMRIYPLALVHFVLKNVGRNM
jgi:hypothetical protein